MSFPIKDQSTIPNTVNTSNGPMPVLRVPCASHAYQGIGMRKYAVLLSS